MPPQHNFQYYLTFFFSVSFLQLNYADISIFDFLNNILLGGKTDVPKELDKFPLLAGHYTRVLNVPEIKAWIEKRPQTTGWRLVYLERVWRVREWSFFFVFS